MHSCEWRSRHLPGVIFVVALCGAACILRRRLGGGAGASPAFLCLLEPKKGEQVCCLQTHRYTTESCASDQLPDDEAGDANHPDDYVDKDVQLGQLALLLQRCKVDSDRQEDNVS